MCKEVSCTPKQPVLTVHCLLYDKTIMCVGMHVCVCVCVCLQDGKPPIHIAVREGLLHIVKYFIEDLKVNPRTPLKVHTYVATYYVW